jgi:hypothetical protein
METVGWGSESKRRTRGNARNEKKRRGEEDRLLIGEEC